MTFKKHYRSGQSILEYFILTAAVTTVVLFFASSKYFTKIKTVCEDGFQQAVNDIIRYK